MDIHIRTCGSDFESSSQSPRHGRFQEQKCHFHCSSRDSICRSPTSTSHGGPSRRICSLPLRAMSEAIMDMVWMLVQGIVSARAKSSGSLARKNRVHDLINQSDKMETLLGISEEPPPRESTHSITCFNVHYRTRTARYQTHSGNTPGRGSTTAFH